MKKFLAFLSALAVFSSPALAYQPPAGASGAIQYNLNNYFTGLLLGDNTLLGSVTSGTPRAITLGSGLSMNGSGVLSSSGSGGTVTSLSVVSANGLAGTVATSTTTPAITLSTTITGLLKGNGTAISGAVSGTDYAPATTGTSILKALSGGFSNAVSGTDYAPATSGSSILKGNSSGGFNNATSGSDYAPATSGTSILKALSGGFTNAVSGTDYAPATSGSSILYASAGGFGNVTVGNGLFFTAGILNQITPTVFDCGDGSIDQTANITSLLSVDGSYLFKGTCKTGSISITGRNLTIEFAQSAILKPFSKIDILWQFTSSNVTLKNFNVDGDGLAQTAYQDTNGTLVAYNPTITNMGYPIDLATAAVFGISLNGTTSTYIDDYTFSNFHSIGNGSCGDPLGEVRGLYMSGTGYVEAHVHASGGTGVEDNDYVHAELNTVGGRLYVDAKYNGNTRRIVKIQSGHWTVIPDFRPGSDFVPDNGSTQVGTYTLNAIDWASGLGGSLVVDSGYMDCTGYSACVANSGGGGGASIVKVSPGVIMQGPTLNAIRNATACNGGLSGGAWGLYTATNDIGSGIEGATIRNFGIPVLLQGKNEFVKNSIFVNPVNIVATIGSGTSRGGQAFIGNRIYTQTSGYLNNTQLIEVQNVPNVDVSDNALIEDPNTTHASTFINVTNSSATGFALNNRGPSGNTIVNPGSSTVIVSGSNGISALPSPLAAPTSITSAVVTPTISTSTFATDASLGNKFVIALNHAACPCTISSPTNPVAGQKIIYEIVQSATGSDTIGTWGAAFSFGAQSIPTLSTSTNLRDIIAFQYSAGLSKWLYIGSEIGF